MPDESPVAVPPSSPGWEFRLSVTLLRGGSARVRLRHRQAIESIPSRITVLDTLQSLALVNRLGCDLLEWVRRMARFFPAELQAAWGAPGYPGDADAIVCACDGIIQHMEELVAWETAAAQAVAAPDCAAVFKRLRGCTGYYFAQFDGLLDAIDTTVQSGTGRHQCTLVFDMPPALIGLESDVAQAGRVARPVGQRHPILTGLGLGFLFGGWFGGDDGGTEC